MAALTPDAISRDFDGKYRRVMAKLPAASDGDTFVTGLRTILEQSIKITLNDSAAVAADSVAVASVSGGTITLQVAGTARKLNVECLGH